MKEYIDRELPLKEIKEYRENDPWWAIRRWWDAYRRRRYFTLFGLVVSKFPAADVEEIRHGRWEFVFELDERNFYRCSECGRQEALLEKLDIKHECPYCHCGAKMDKEE